MMRRLNEHQVESTGVALSILSISLVLEGGTLGVALLECQKGEPTFRYPLPPFFFAQTLQVQRNWA